VLTVKCIVFPVLLLVSTAAYPHGGGLDGQGGHNNRRGGQLPLPSGAAGRRNLRHQGAGHRFGSESAGEMDALILRDLMGHKSLRTTLKYVQVNGESVKKAFRAFDRQNGRK
jgi:hypothetical protein